MYYPGLYSASTPAIIQNSGTGRREQWENVSVWLAVLSCETEDNKEKISKAWVLAGQIGCCQRFIKLMCLSMSALTH